VTAGLLPGRWKVYFKPPTTSYAGEYYADKTSLGEGRMGDRDRAKRGDRHRDGSLAAGLA
jgi:hypothetical protein